MTKSSKSPRFCPKPGFCNNRWETAAVAVLLCLGIGIRWAYLDRIAIEHFDEGVYGCDTWFANGYAFRYLYAPSLLPKLIYLSILFFPPTTYGPAIPNLIAGSMTLLVVWRMSRRWFGSIPGLATLAVAAGSQIHIAFSRTALTDPLFVIWMVIAIDRFSCFLESPRLRQAAFSGVATGLAWSAKYNGWYPLAITAATIGVLAMSPTSRPGTGRRIIGWLFAACIAGLIWLPSWWSLPNGYGEVAANHSKYIVGLSGWSESARHQLQQLSQFDGIGLLGLAALAGAWLLLSTAKNHWGRRTDQASSESPGVPLRLGVSTPQVLLAVWFCSALLATPLYTPYARLTLPWVAANWIAIGYLAERLTVERPSSIFLSSFLPSRLTGTVLVLGIALAILSPFALRGVIAWEDRTGISQMAGQIADNIPTQPGSMASLAVFGEPAVIYQLFSRNVVAVPIVDLKLNDNPRHDAWRLPILVGPHALSDPTFRQDWELHRDKFEIQSEFSVALSSIARIDEQAPLEIESRQTSTFSIYRLRRR